MKTFTLRCGSSTKATRVDDWHLSIYGDEMEMSCKIVRQDRPPQWSEIRSGVMVFRDSNGKIYKGKYIDWWWRVRVPLSEAGSGIRFWPHELYEGNEQYVNSCEIDPRHLAQHPLTAQLEPEVTIEMPEPRIVPVEETVTEPEPEPEGVVTPFAVLGDEDDRPIEEVKAELKSLVEESTEEAVEAETEDSITSAEVLITGHLDDHDGPVTEVPIGAELDVLLKKPLVITETLTEQPLEAEPETKPAWTKGMEEAAEKRETKKETLICPICGITTTKNGKPFKSELSVKRHIAAAHKKTRDTE